ncbi:MAG: NAD(P)H-hydrate dehydratase [Henriciella sp.]|uniref:NAD(P)H-hydrate dehydratase n=1 Tax=Henriciella sp. TaxID=1968823 RepID=UPI003C7386A0
MTRPAPKDNSPDLWLEHWPWPDTAGHKYNRGHLGCVTGPPSSTGASRLSARAGLRIGAGLVTLLSPPASVIVNAAHSTAVMVKAFADPAQLADLTSTMACVLIGPAAGTNPVTAENVLSVLGNADASVLDADALTVFKDDPDRLFSHIKRPCVFTPHEGEFERIFPGLLKESGRDGAALKAAEISDAIIILKGAETLIASPGGELVINRHASPFLATAGSGDVLAGIVAGLLAQEMPAFHAACAAVWTHGEAGRRLGPGLIAEDLPEILPSIQSDFHASKP